VGQAQTDTTEDLLTDHPVTDDYSALLGLGYNAFGDWRFEVDGTVSQALTVTDVTYTYIPTGALEFLINDYRDKYDTWSADFKADGSLFSLPSGKVRLATGMSYRKDDLISTRDQVIPDLGPATHANYSRNVDSVFAELFVPIVSREQGYSWARRIDLSLAARYDDYSDFGKTTNPKVGLVWTPVDSLDVRASYGTSFRAPTVLEESQVTRGIQISNVDLDALNGSLVPAFYLAGSEPLTAERAKDTSIGFTFKPQSVKGAAITFNYFNIDYTNRRRLTPLRFLTAASSAAYSRISPTMRLRKPIWLHRLPRALFLSINWARARRECATYLIYCSRTRPAPRPTASISPLHTLSREALIPTILILTLLTSTRSSTRC
jgi:outer membrane receptor protein involved in Fe transport